MLEAWHATARARGSTCFCDVYHEGRTSVPAASRPEQVIRTRNTARNAERGTCRLAFMRISPASSGGRGGRRRFLRAGRQILRVPSGPLTLLSGTRPRSASRAVLRVRINLLGRDAAGTDDATLDGKTSCRNRLSARTRPVACRPSNMHHSLPGMIRGIKSKGIKRSVPTKVAIHRERDTHAPEQKIGFRALGSDTGVGFACSASVETGRNVHAPVRRHAFRRRSASSAPCLSGNHAGTPHFIAHFAPNWVATKMGPYLYSSAYIRLLIFACFAVGLLGRFALVAVAASPIDNLSPGRADSDDRAACAGSAIRSDRRSNNFVLEGNGCG